MTDKSILAKPWSSICKLNDTPRSAKTVPRHCQKTEEWVVPLLLEWSSHSLTYEITQLTKMNHIPQPLHSSSVMAHTLGVCLSLNPNKSTSYLLLGLSRNFFFLQWDIKNLNFDWNQAPGILAGLQSWLDTAEWLSAAQSPWHAGLSPNLRETVSHTIFGNGKMMTCPILCKQWHKWREALKDGRRNRWGKRA